MNAISLSCGSSPPGGRYHDLGASGQIEEQRLALALPLEDDLALVAHRGGVAGAQELAAHLDLAAHHVHPRASAGGERVPDLLARAQDRRVQARVLVDGDAAFAAVARGDEPELAALVLVREALLLV